MCALYCGFSIQKGAGHCNLEDARATREAAFTLIGCHTNDGDMPMPDILEAGGELVEGRPEKFPKNVEEA